MQTVRIRPRSIVAVLALIVLFAGLHSPPYVSASPGNVDRSLRPAPLPRFSRASGRGYCGSSRRRARKCRQQCTPGPNANCPGNQRCFHIIRCQKPTKYVALGGSFAAGWGLPDYYPGTEQESAGNECTRSPQAYPALVSERCGLPLVFQACRAAHTRHLFEPQPGSLGRDVGLGPQLDALDGQTALVTFSAGGNEIGFGRIFRLCILSTFACKIDSNVRLVEEALECLGMDCRAGVGVGSCKSDVLRRCRERRVYSFDTIIKTIKKRAPRAKVAFVGYPTFFSPDEPSGLSCLSPILSSDRAWFNEVVMRLNAVSARAARRRNIEWVDPEPEFEGHRYCGPAEDWFYSLARSGILGAPDGAAHPNVDGQRALARAIVSQTLDGTKLC